MLQVIYKICKILKKWNARTLFLGYRENNFGLRDKQNRVWKLIIQQPNAKKSSGKFNRSIWNYISNVLTRFLRC